VLFGVLGLKKHGRETPKGKGASISGLIIGGLALILGIVGMSIFFGAVDQFDQDMQEIFEDF